MSLITCSECGKQISDKAASCPNCGCPVEKKSNGMEAIQNYHASDYPVYPKTPKGDKKKDSVLSVIAAVLAIFVVTSFIGLIIGLIDLGAFRKDGKRHLGSWFAVILGIALLILTHGKIMVFF